MLGATGGTASRYSKLADRSIPWYLLVRQYVTGLTSLAQVI